MRYPIIALLSDFGLKDPYVAEMKGIILSVCRKATLVDVSHNVSKFDVREGAFMLARSAPYLPKGTVNLAVVDPGVGSDRRAIVVEGKRNLYVGPDNGLLMLASSMEGIRSVYEIRNKALMLSKVSRTFHGRDVFAPVTAHLAKGVPPKEVGPKILDYFVPNFATPEVRGASLVGEVMYVDGFGNAVTNIPERFVRMTRMHDGDNLKVSLGERSWKVGLCGSYEEGTPGNPLAIIGSAGFLEFAEKQGSATKLMKIKVGDPVRVDLVTRMTGSGPS